MKKTYLLIGIGGIAIGGILLGRYFWVKKKRKEISESLGTIPNTPILTTTKTTTNFPLRVGSGMGDLSFQSSNVKKLQKAINELAPTPYTKLVVDGKFGNKTLNLLNVVVKNLNLSTKGVNSVTENLFNRIILQSNLPKLWY